MNYSHTPKHEAEHAGWTTTTKLVVAILLVILFGLAVSAFQAILAPLIIAGVMAYVLHPLVALVSRLTRMPHSVATGLIYLIVLVGVVVLATVLTPVLAVQAENLRVELENLIAALLDVANESFVFLSIEIEVQSLVDELATALQGLARTVAADIVTIAFGVAETALLTIFVFLMAFYLTRDAEKLRVWLRSLIPPGYQSDSDQILADIDRVWAGFFRGQLILAIVVGLIITILATAIGLPRPVLWGVFASFMEFLPSIGHSIWIVTALLVAFFEGSTTLPISNVAFVVLVGGAHLVFAQFDLNFLIPRIIGRQVNLHPMVVIIGIIVGASVGGVLGVALAAPVIASIRVLGRYVYCRLFGLDPFADSITAQGDDDDAPAEDAPAQVAHDEAIGGVHEEVA